MPVVGDDVLLRRLSCRDEAALGLLYDRHGGSAFALAYRVLGDSAAAEEAVQDAFFAAWRRADSFRLERGSVRNWLLAIVHHRSIDRLRLRRARPQTVPLDGAAVLRSGDTPLHVIVANDDRAALRAAVDAIPPEQRTVVQLAFFAGLTYPEIAAQTGVPLGTVKSRLRLALTRLRALVPVDSPLLSDVPTVRTDRSAAGG